MGKSEIQINQEYWDRKAQSFHNIYSKHKSFLMRFLDGIFRKDMLERFVFTIKNCEPIQKRNYLDVGCGTGFYSFELLRRGAEHVTGLDVAEKMLEICIETARKENLESHCRFVHSDLLAYNADGVFDVTFGIGLFDYIKTPLPVIRKMKAVSRDKVIASFPRLGTWRAPIRKIRLGLLGCPVYFYSKNSVRRLFEDAGIFKFDIEKVGKLFCVVGHCE